MQTYQISSSPLSNPSHSPGGAECRSWSLPPRLGTGCRRYATSRTPHNREARHTSTPVAPVRSRWHWPLWLCQISNPLLSAALCRNLQTFPWTPRRSGRPFSSAWGTWGRPTRWAEDSSFSRHIQQRNPTQRCTRSWCEAPIVTVNSYIEVDLCMVAGFYRPHHLQSGLKEKKQPVRMFHRTEPQGKAKNHGIGSTYVVSIRFCRKRQSMCSCGRPLHPLWTAKSQCHNRNSPSITLAAPVNISPRMLASSALRRGWLSISNTSHRKESWILHRMGSSIPNAARFNTTTCSV